MPRARRTALIAIALAAIVAIGALAAGRFLATSSPGGRSAGMPAGEPQLAQLAIGGPFTLQDPSGRVVTQASFPGRWLLIYFGYTNCPDICPTTLQAVAGALAQLGPRADHLAPLFITIDPERDTPAVLARYTALFDRRLIGLTGSAQHIAAAEQAFRVYAARAGQSGSAGYTMDHTSFLYLIDPAAHLAGLYDRNISAAKLAAKLDKAVP